MKSKENQREKDIRQYLRNVAKALPPKGRKTLLPGIRSGVASYLAENPQATMEDVAAYVGTPECIANEYYANQDGRKITQEMRIGRKALLLFLAVLLTAALAFGAVLLTAVLLCDEGYDVYELEVVSRSVVTTSDWLGK